MSPCVWYVTKYLIIPASGEAASRGYGLMREIARLGCRSVIVTSDSMGMFNAPTASESYAIESRDGITLCSVRTLKYSISQSIGRISSWIHFEWKLLRLPDKRLPNPDVIIVSSLSLLTVLNGIRLRRRYRCRLVFEVRDIWPLTLTEEGGFSPWNPLVLALGLIERLGYRQADAIVGTMPNLGEHVEKVTGKLLPTYCIPMGVDSEAIQNPIQITSEYADTYIPKRRLIVAYAGSIGISNALDVFFDCAKMMQLDPEIGFVVLGDGHLRKAYEDRYRSLPNLTFAPRLPKHLVHDFVSHCDLLFLSVHKSSVWRYGLSLNKLIDYMLAGKPIVASYSGHPSMINEAGCGVFVPAGDVMALRNEIRRFAEMPPEDRDAMGARGRSWLLENRNYSDLARDYLNILLPRSSSQATERDAK